MKKKGFTLIELIAVLVIMAIIALIVTPLVLNIINKAKDSSNKRSVDAYGRSIELSIATYMMDNGKYPTSIDDLTIAYSDHEVECKTKQINDDGSIYLSQCSVDKQEVKDKTDDGYYHYGKPLTYKEYKIGNQITYNGMNFYVIANSDETSDSVTLLKAEPLTVEEVNIYGESNSITATDYNGYGAIEFGDNNNYDTSKVKLIVDAWATNKFKTDDLKEDSTGYDVRLITYDDLTDHLGYEKTIGTIHPSTNGETPEWVYNSQYDYWTMTPDDDISTHMWYVSSNSNPMCMGFILSPMVVRPVVTLLKSAIK